MQIELLDESGNPLPGFSMADMDPMFGDSLDRMVEWKGKGDVSELSGQTIRMRFILKDADLFAFQFAQ